MRSSLFLALFVAASSLRAAGPTVSLGFESRSELFTSGDAAFCSASALVDLGDRIFLAWPAVQNGDYGIVATLISDNLAEIPGTRVFIRDEERMLCVAAATTGSEIALVWLTPQRRVKVVFLDKALQALAPTRLLLSGSSEDARPTVVWQTGAATYLASVGSRLAEFRLSSDGVVVRGAPQFLGGSFSVISDQGVTNVMPSYSFDAAAVSPTTSAVSVQGYVPGYTGCNFRGSCTVFPAKFALAVVRPHNGAARMIAELPAIMPPSTISCTPRDCVVIYPTRVGFNLVLRAKWLDGAGEMPVVDGLESSNGLNSASDGDDVLVVWENTHVIVGAVIRGGTITKPFAIATSSRKPAVIATGPDTFLVAYEVTDATGLVRIAGRHVFLDAPARRRAAQ